MERQERVSPGGSESAPDPQGAGIGGGDERGRREADRLECVVARPRAPTDPPWRPRAELQASSLAGRPPRSGGGWRPNHRTPRRSRGSRRRTSDRPGGSAGARSPPPDRLLRQPPAVDREPAGNPGTDLHQRERAAVCLADGGGDEVVLEDARRRQHSPRRGSEWRVRQVEVGGRTPTVPRRRRGRACRVPTAVRAFGCALVQSHDLAHELVDPVGDGLARVLARASPSRTCPDLTQLPPTSTARNGPWEAATVSPGATGKRHLAEPRRVVRVEPLRLRERPGEELPGHHGQKRSEQRRRRLRHR